MTGQRFPEFARFADELARLRGRMQGLFADARRDIGLGEMELTVLTATVNAATAPTVAQIGRSLGHPRQVVQRAANRLDELGLIRFADNPGHKRASLLMVTDAGEAMIAQDRALTGSVVETVLTRIPAAQFADSARQLAAIRAEIEAYLREEGR